MYQDFIIALVKKLEPRHFIINQIIHEELDEVNEFLFILKGNFDIGYEINKKKFYRIKFGPNNVLEAFNLHFRLRTQFVYRAGSAMNCFSYSKRNWNKLMSQFPEFNRQLSIKIFHLFEKQVHRHMADKKFEHLYKISQREDFD